MSDELNIYPEITERIRVLIDENIPVLLMGHAGLGKSYTARIAVNDLPCVSLNLSRQNDLIDLLGQYVLLTEEDKNGNKISVTKWKDGKVTDAAKNGKVLILEELSMADQNILAALHGLFEVPQKLTTLEGDIDVSPNFRVICTCNPSWCDYEGVSELNYALEDRFASINFGFPEKEKLEKYLEPYAPNFEKTEIKMDSFYELVNELYEKYPENIPFYMSLRGIKTFARLLEYFSVRECFDIAYLNKIDPDERQAVIDIIDNYIPF